MHLLGRAPEGYQPLDTPPGGALVFELWQNAGGEMSREHLFCCAEPGANAQEHSFDTGIPAAEVSDFRAGLQYVRPKDELSLEGI